MASSKIPAPETPIPRRAHESSSSHTALTTHAKCRLDDDAPILLDDVRQGRKRRWWAFTAAVTIFSGSLLTMFLLIFDTGQAVGKSETELDTLQEHELEDRKNIRQLRGDLRMLERSNTQQLHKIETTLVRMQAQLDRIERAANGADSKRRRR